MSRTVTKADIIERINQRVGYSKKESADIVETLLDAMKDALSQGEKVKISGFGNFEVRSKSPRIGRNPQTKEEIEISARRVLTFKPSQVIKKMMSREPARKETPPGGLGSPEEGRKPDSESPPEPIF